MKYNLLDMERLANKHGGLCLSREYIPASRGKMKWKCDQGHIWEAPSDSIIKGRWCPICSKSPKLSIKDIHEIGLKNGYKCLSSKYLGFDTQLVWEDQIGSVFKATPREIIEKHSNNKKNAIQKKEYSLKDAEIIATKNKGRCLSDKYTNDKSKLTWECSKKHTFEKRLSDVRDGAWCPICLQERMLKDAKQLAKRNGGQLVSERVYREGKLLKWKCKRGHNFTKTLIEAKKSWCHICEFEIKERPMLEKIIKNRAGEILKIDFSKKPISVTYKCKHKHVSIAALDELQKGAWCKTCDDGHREARYVMLVIRKILGTVFPKSSPYWIKSRQFPSSIFDGYAKYKKIAILVRRAGEKDSYYEHMKVACKSRGVKLLLFDHGLDIQSLPDVVEQKLRDNMIHYTRKKWRFKFEDIILTE
jgi:hypothetical protein